MSNSWICSADSEAKRFNLGDAMYIKVKTFSIQKLVLASSNEWCINLYCDTIFWTYLNLTTMGLNNFCWSVFSLFHLHFGIKSFLKLQIYQSDVPVRFAVKIFYQSNLPLLFMVEKSLSRTFFDVPPVNLIGKNF